MSSEKFTKSLHSQSAGCVEVAFTTSRHTAQDNCVEIGFVKSRHSTKGSCVEMGSDEALVAVRDSKDPNGGILTFTRKHWLTFIDGVKNSEFDIR